MRALQLPSPRRSLRRVPSVGGEAAIGLLSAPGKAVQPARFGVGAELAGMADHRFADRSCCLQRQQTPLRFRFRTSADA